jgi:hypothetical protein
MFGGHHGLELRRMLHRTRLMRGVVHRPADDIDGGDGLFQSRPCTENDYMIDDFVNDETRLIKGCGPWTSTTCVSLEGSKAVDLQA